MTPSLRLSLSAARTTREAAAAAPSREICGLLIETRDGVGAHLTPNRHPNPELGFAICDAAYATIQRTARAGGGTVIGCIHSHPSGETSPSETDLLAAAEDGFIWLICAPSGAMEAWRLRLQGGAKWFEPLKMELNESAQAAA